ncbi:MAG: DUF4198 domain-containing protein [Pseudomonadota bacterium]
MNKLYRIVGTLLATLLVCMAGSVAAHQQWLSPNSFIETGDSAWITFDHSFSDRRFYAGSGPGSYYSWWVVGPDGLKRAVPALFVGKTRTVGELELTVSGTYRVEGVEDSMLWTRVKINGEETWQPGGREEFSAESVLQSRIYFSKAVTYISLGAPSRGALSPTGEPLEIVFTEHPNSITTGTAFTVTVLADGEPIAEHPIRVYSQFDHGHDPALTCTTNTAGLCSISPAKSGRYLLETSMKGDFQGNPNVDGYVNGYTVLIDVSDQ